MDGAIIAPRVIKRLDQHLLAYFDFSQSSQCINLKSSIAHFMNALCERLDAELIQKSVEHRDKSFDDWRSWYIDETSAQQSNAIGEFAHTIGDIEAFSPTADKKIPCDMGYRNFQEFALCWRRACAGRQAQLNILPQSTKAQNKRRGHEWAPYFSDLFKRA